MPVYFENRDEHSIQELSLAAAQIFMHSTIHNLEMDGDTLFFLSEIEKQAMQVAHLYKCYNMSRCHHKVPEEFMDDRII